MQRSPERSGGSSIDRAGAADGITAGERSGRRTRGAGDDRGQTEILGYVLLVGLSLAVISATVIVGSIAYGSATADAEVSNVENAMSHLSSKTTLVALGSDTERTFSIGTLSEGKVAIEEDRGTLKLHNVPKSTDVGWNDVEDDEHKFHEMRLGVIEYTNDDERVALQGGGVWKLQGDYGSMITPPEYHYRQTTLTFPIVNVTGEGSTTGTPQGSITEVETDPIEGEDAPTNPIENETIVVEVQSDYYQGWYEFFETRAEGSALIDHDEQRVIAVLQHTREVNFDNGVIWSHEAEKPDVQNTDDVDLGGPSVLPPVQPAIDKAIADAEADSKDLESNEGGTLTSGTYYHEGDLDFGATDLDTADGNITIVVDGDLDIEGDLSIVDTQTDNHVEYYVNGSLESNSIEVKTDGEEPEPWRHRLFVGGEVFAENEGYFGEYHALIYAPESFSTGFTGGGNSELIGSLTVGGFDSDTGGHEIGNVEIEYVEGIEAYSPMRLPDPPAPVTYIHVSENTIEVTLE